MATRSRNFNSFADKVINASASGKFVQVRREKIEATATTQAGYGLTLNAVATLSNTSTLWKAKDDGTFREDYDRVFVPGIYLAGKAVDIQTILSSPQTFADEATRAAVVNWFQNCVNGAFTAQNWNSPAPYPGFVELVKSVDPTQAGQFVRRDFPTFADAFKAVWDMHDTAKKAAGAKSKSDRAAKAETTDGLGGLDEFLDMAKALDKAKKAGQIQLVARNATGVVTGTALLPTGRRQTASATDRLAKAAGAGKFINVNNAIAGGAKARSVEKPAGSGILLSPDASNPLHRAFFTNSADPSKAVEHKTGAVNFLVAFFADRGQAYSVEEASRYVESLVAAATASAIANPVPKKTRASSAPAPAQIPVFYGGLTAAPPAAPFLAPRPVAPLAALPAPTMPAMGLPPAFRPPSPAPAVGLPPAFSRPF